MANMSGRKGVSSLNKQETLKLSPCQSTHSYLLEQSMIQHLWTTLQVSTFHSSVAQHHRIYIYILTSIGILNSFNVCFDYLIS